MNTPIYKRLLIHFGIILVFIFAMAVAAHYALQYGTRHNVRCTVPKFEGISLAEAENLAKESNLKIHINDSIYVPTYAGGTVLEQLPNSGVSVKPGRTIYVTINAFNDKMVKVPYVAERSLRQAKNMLEIAGLEIKRLIYVPDMATNYVLRQQCEGQHIRKNSNIKAVMGTGVTLYVGVSDEDNVTVVPNLIGLTLTEAKGRIWESGMNVGTVNVDSGIDVLSKKNARVYIQNLTPTHRIGWGSNINISITLDNKKVDKSSVSITEEIEELELQRETEELNNDSDVDTVTENDNFFE